MSKILDKIQQLRVQQITRSQDKLLLQFLFDKDFARTMSRHPLHACLSEWLPQQPGAKVLELGCGPGKYVALLSTLGFQVVGVDPYAFATWDILRKETSAQLVEHVFAEDLPFADQHFDCVVCLGALLYFNDPRQALREICRVLKPGGRVIIRTVNRENLYTSWTGRKLDPASHSLYTMAELQELITASGLTVARSFSYGFWPPVCTDSWWYLVCVWVPIAVQEALSSMLTPARRVNHIVFATSPLHA